MPDAHHCQHPEVYLALIDHGQLFANDTNLVDCFHNQQVILLG